MASSHGGIEMATLEAANIIATNIKEVDEVLKHFDHFHDDYVAGIEIKFENYKGLDENSASTGIKSADKTIILIINYYPYGKEHEQFVCVEFKGVKSFEMSSALQDYGPKAGPTWGIDSVLTQSEGIDIKWEFYWICGETKFIVVCTEIVFSTQ